MKNWNTDTTRLAKDPPAYERWKLEQLINYGLDDEKLDKQKVIQYWDQLDIDPQKREVLQFLIWPNQS